MTRLSFRCSDELVKRVDEARGPVPRETYLRMLIVRAMDDQKANVIIGPDLKPIPIPTTSRNTAR